MPELTDTQVNEIERRISEIWELIMFRRVRDGKLYDKDIIDKSKELAVKLKEFGIV
ncbi:MAG: hypothetical protein ACUVTD_08150 [Nitrososphaerales archaeon]